MHIHFLKIMKKYFISCAIGGIKNIQELGLLGAPLSVEAEAVRREAASGEAAQAVKNLPHSPEDLVWNSKHHRKSRGSGAYP